MTGEEMSDVRFMGIKISSVNFKMVYEKLSDVLANNETGYVCLNDVGNIIEATRDEDLRAAINESTFSLADGMPLAWYAKLAGCPEMERISGMDIMKGLLSEKNGLKHYLLGDTEEMISKVISEAKRLNEDISIIGKSPPFKAFTDADDRKIINDIKAAAPDIIWVSFGGGKQEKWMHQHIKHLDRGIMIGVGAAFKWLIGEIKAPPKIVQTMGFQWLYRLAHEFKKDPVEASRMLKRRKFFNNRFIFLANLPYEVSAARKCRKSLY